MSVRINTNIEALNAQRNLSATASVFAKSVEKLSSGLRINRAADDSAGLAISEKLKAQVMGLNQAQRNAQDGVSMVQTAEGALTEVHSMLARIRELAVEAANSTLSSTDAASVSTEITSLRAEIDRIAKATSFNGQFLLTGTLSVGQSGGTLAVGGSVGATVIASIDMSGAKASSTYTLSSQAGPKVTLSDGSGHMQQLTVAANAQTLNFDTLGVSITLTGTDSAANIAAGLAAGPGGVSTIGGAANTDLVNTDVLTVADATPAAVYGTVTYGADGLEVTAPPTATASAGVAAGTLMLSWDGVGTVSSLGSVGGETFTGTLDPTIAAGRASSITLTGSRGNTIQLDYTQGSAPTLSGIGFDLAGAQFDFTTVAGTAAVSALTVPTATAGTYTLTSGGANSLTLSGPGGASTIAIGNMLANASQTLTFTNGVSFTLNADLNGMTAANAITSLLTPQNNTIVVNAGAPGAGKTLITGAGSDANFQIGANAADFLGVSFADATVTASGFGNWNTNITTFATATGNGNGIVAAAQALITSSDTAITYISTTRGNLGAVQNRLEHTIASISVASENLNASQSRIRDLDVASEMVNFTKTQILQQAGTAILAQANSAPQGILTLLR